MCAEGCGCRGVYRCVCVGVCSVCVGVCVCSWRITALEGRGLSRAQGIETQTEGEGGGATREGRMGGETVGGAWAEAPPQPRDPATCSCPWRRPSTEREGQRSSHSDCRASERFWTGSSPHRGRGQRTAGPMEPPSGPASSRRVPWNRLLLAGERGQFSVRWQRLENKGLAGLWGRRALRGGRGLLFRPERRGRGAGRVGARPQGTLHELESVRGGKTSTGVGFVSYSLLSNNSTCLH